MEPKRLGMMAVRLKLLRSSWRPLPFYPFDRKASSNKKHYVNFLLFLSQSQHIEVQQFTIGQFHIWNKQFQIQEIWSALITLVYSSFQCSQVNCDNFDTCSAVGITPTSTAPNIRPKIWFTSHGIDFSIFCHDYRFQADNHHTIHHKTTPWLTATPY